MMGRMMCPGRASSAASNSASMAALRSETVPVRSKRDHNASPSVIRLTAEATCQLGARAASRPRSTAASRSSRSPVASDLVSRPTANAVNWALRSAGVVPGKVVARSAASMASSRSADSARMLYRPRSACASSDNAFAVIALFVPAAATPRRSTSIDSVTTPTSPVRSNRRASKVPSVISAYARLVSSSWVRGTISLPISIASASRSSSPELRKRRRSVLAKKIPAVFRPGLATGSPSAATRSNSLASASATWSFDHCP